MRATPPRASQGALTRLRASSVAASLALVGLILAAALTQGCRGDRSDARTPLDTLQVDALPTLPVEAPPALQALREPAAPTLLISAALHGYTEPCGCTEDVLQGGIDRLVGAARYLDAAMPATLFVSAGDTLYRFETPEGETAAQDAMRLDLLAHALRHAELRVLGVGPRDLSGGVDTLLRFIDATGASAVSTNLRVAGRPAAMSRGHVERLDGRPVAFLNLVEAEALTRSPALKDLELLPLEASLQSALDQPEIRDATLRVLFFHGSRETALSLLRDVPGVDIVIFGLSHTPSDEVLAVGHSAGLQLWSQGRELGVLRLHDDAPPKTDDSATDEAPRWQNARALSHDEHAGLKELLTTVEAQISELEARIQGGDEPPILARLRARAEGYREELNAAPTATALHFETGARSYAWDTLALRPDIHEDPEIQTQRLRYNAALQTANLQNATPPPAAPEGHASFVGEAACASCHSAAHAHWRDTPHAGAYDTLVAREKHFDLECVSCHLTGYQQPGGSSLGFSDGLTAVQCESCHGPSSLHAAAPSTHAPSHTITRESAELTCIGCHNAEHSPSFDFDSYYARILGAGHGYAAE